MRFLVSAHITFTCYGVVAVAAVVVTRTEIFMQRSFSCTGGNHEYAQHSFVMKFIYTHTNMNC